MATAQEKLERKKFLADLKKDAATIKKAGNTEARTGYTTTADIVKAFGLKAGKSCTTKAKLVSIKYGISKPKAKGKKPERFFSFQLVTVGEVPGQTPSIYIGLTPVGKRTKEMIYEQITSNMQRVGLVTKNATPEKLVELADEYNERDDKSIVLISLKLGTPMKGKDVGLLNVDILRALEDADESAELEDDEEEFEDEDTDGDDEDEDTDGDEEDDDSEEDDSDESEEEDEEDEDSEDDEESEDDDDEDESEYDADDPSTWIGYECKAKPTGTTKTATYTITKFIPKGKKLEIENSKGKKFTVGALTVEVV